MPSGRRDLELALKRALDFGGAAIALVLLAPLLAAIAAAVRVTSRGPAIYRGERIGLRGEPFRILKFRTMVVDAEAVGGPTTAAGDPRITPLGRRLRASKLDELPQLWNVLRGDMSFVGPRPEVMSYLGTMSEEDRLILTLRPGITDLASLRFNDLQAIVGESDPESVYRERVLPEKRRLQRAYASEWSLWVDASIVARTVWLVITKPLRGSV